MSEQPVSGRFAHRSPPSGSGRHRRMQAEASQATASQIISTSGHAPDDVFDNTQCLTSASGTHPTGTTRRHPCPRSRRGRQRDRARSHGRRTVCRRTPPPGADRCSCAFNGGRWSRALPTVWAESEPRTWSEKAAVIERPCHAADHLSVRRSFVSPDRSCGRRTPRTRGPAVPPPRPTWTRHRSPGCRRSATPSRGSPVAALR